MKAMDKIIRYSSIKRDFNQTGDTLKNCRKDKLIGDFVNHIKETCKITPVAL